MAGARRREQVLQIAAEEFAEGGLHGTSTEAIARRAGITQAYVFRMFTTKKNLFITVMRAAFDRITDGMRDAAGTTGGLDALTLMGAQYYATLADRTVLLLQLQGFAACGDAEVREAVRASVARMWETVAGITGADPVTIKSFLAFGMLRSSSAALQLADVPDEWAQGIRTRIQPGLFQHITADTNR